MMKSLTENLIDKEKINYNLTQKTSYGNYLCLDQILSAQKYRSKNHHIEHLFITVHQISELWLSVILINLKESLVSIQSDNLSMFHIYSNRIQKSQDQLIQLWDVLSTMTPTEYLSIRDSLGESSGFQSYQYRMFEFILGNKNKNLCDMFLHDPKVHEKVLSILNSPSLYDEVIMLLVRRGLLLPKVTENRDWSTPYRSREEITRAWLKIYRDKQSWNDLHQVAEALINIEDRFQKWRFCHFKSVQRLIGNKSGTGGTTGGEYLKKVLGLTFFPELYQVRNCI